MPFERSVWVDVTAMVLCVLAAYAGWRAIPELSPIATPRWHVFSQRLPAPPPEVQTKEVVVKEDLLRIDYLLHVTRHTTGLTYTGGDEPTIVPVDEPRISPGTPCLLSVWPPWDPTSSETDDATANQSCRLRLACGDREVLDGRSPCGLSAQFGTIKISREESGIALAYESRWGNCNGGILISIDTKEGRMTLRDRNGYGGPELESESFDLVFSRPQLPVTSVTRR